MNWIKISEEGYYKSHLSFMNSDDAVHHGEG